MILLLALTVGGLVFVLVMPGPPVPQTPWDGEATSGQTWFSRRQQADRELLHTAGIKSAALFRLARVLLIAAGALAMAWLLGAFSAIPGAIITWLLVSDWLRSRREKRINEFADQFRDFLHSLVNSLRAGRSIPQAIYQSYRDLIRVPGRAERLLASELGRIVDELGRGGSIDAALAGFAPRIPLEEVRLFADAVSLCRTRGGNLVQVLQTLIRLNADRFQVQQEVRVQTAEKRLEGTILALMPVIMLGLLSVISPDYMSPLLGNAVGKAAVSLGLMVVVAAYLLAQRLARVEM